MSNSPANVDVIAPAPTNPNPSDEVPATAPAQAMEAPVETAGEVAASITCLSEQGIMAASKRSLAQILSSSIV